MFGKTVLISLYGKQILLVFFMDNYSTTNSCSSGHCTNGYMNNSSSLSRSSHALETKIFCDPVHGHIALHPACTLIIDTPQFQRLRHIKQTGFLDFVYPGATHNRFGHGLGVCYLSGTFLKELKERQPELCISNKDILCVEIAGLCHDLGHGPFSHCWESFMRESNARRGCKTEWKHEQVSVNILDYLIEENHLEHKLAEYGISHAERKLIKNLITRDQPVDEEKAFLYQIVNNEESGLDVDKWDYFLRDSLYLGLRCNFEYKRLIQFAKVLDVNGKKQICFRDKVLEAIYNAFRTRSNLHRLAYQHRVVTVIEKMFCDALVAADEKVVGPWGEHLHLWEWSHAAAQERGIKLRQVLEKYCMLNDMLVFNCIRYSSRVDLRRSVQILTAIERRSCKGNGFYHFVALKVIPYKPNKAIVVDGLAKFLPAANAEVKKSFSDENFSSESIFDPISIEDFAINVVSIHWGKREKNPVEFVHFYCKDSPFTINPLNHEELSVILPRSFEEIQLHVLCSRSDPYALQVAKICFENYWQSSKCSHL